MMPSDESLIQFAKDAQNPFQFIANVLSIKGERDPDTIPVTLHASSSAYQIMSYLLIKMAINTNLIRRYDP